VNAAAREIEEENKRLDRKEKISFPKKMCSPFIMSTELYYFSSAAQHYTRVPKNAEMS
jgi:hypothetical protein